MKKILAFNWKMGPQSFSQARTLADLTRNYADKSQTNAEIIIAPPFIYLQNLIASASVKGYAKLCFASQNVFWSASGQMPAGRSAYTGEISPKMLKNLGVEYVIIGHSERRQHLNETDEIINKKVLATLKAGLKVILCVGENLTIRKRGEKAVENFIKSQLKKDLKNIKNLKLKIKNLIIAYEPIWAIGTNHSDTPEDALEIIKFIKQTLLDSGYTQSPKILYGGSVDSKNIKNFVKYDEIDGFLIGHASLQPKEIKNIIKLI